MTPKIIEKERDGFLNKISKYSLCFLPKVRRQVTNALLFPLKTIF